MVQRDKGTQQARANLAAADHAVGPEHALGQ